MLHKQLSRLLGSGILLLFAATLALTACNSSSGTSQKAPGSGNTVTGAESPTPAKVPAKGTMAEAVARKLKGAP
jgi:hypothetical protein